MQKSLHLISFDIPYPPNYGGVIDVFFKIVELSKQNISVYLHTYLYNDKSKQKELEKYCSKVFYYKRKNNFWSLFSLLPMRIKSRENSTLLENLNSINAPILFEGLHTTFPLLKNNLSNKTYVRTHNIEHKYFYGLAKSEQNIFKKIFFYTEGLKLKYFEKQLFKANGIFTISLHEQKYFSSIYGNKCAYIPAFHQTKTPANYSKKGDFILYHGDLRVSDNVKTALFLISCYQNSKFKLIIASSCENIAVIKEIKNYKNIEFVNITDQKTLEKLFTKAHVNSLLTFQKTGIKLKLLNTLYQGKFIISNTKMIEDTGLEGLCELANTREEILQKTEMLFSKEFTEFEIEKRQEKLKLFNPTKSAKKIIENIFKH